jgi:hypothetical protein
MSLESSIQSMGGLCRDEQVKCERLLQSFPIGTEWKCPYSATVMLYEVDESGAAEPLGETQYNCGMKFTRLSANTVRQATGSVCLKSITTAHSNPDDWDKHLRHAEEAALS